MRIVLLHTSDFRNAGILRALHLADHVQEFIHDR
jgi:hypothetical protein